MCKLRSLVSTRTTCAAMAALLFVLCPTGANAQSIVGHGKVEIRPQAFAQVSVDAWVDADGVAQGWMLVTASAELLFGEPGPYVVFIAVTDISIRIGAAGEAQVFGFIVSPAVSFGGDILASFRFDPATGLAETFDEDGSLNLHGTIDAGKIIVDD